MVEASFMLTVRFCYGHTCPESDSVIHNKRF